MRRPFAAALVAALIGVACSSEPPELERLQRPDGPGNSGLIAAGGDIACDWSDGGFNGGEGSGTDAEARCKQAATARLIIDRNPEAVLTLGDNQYEMATLDRLLAVYDKSWGAFKERTHPSAADRDYADDDGASYFDYFGAAAHPPDGWYSVDIAGWHIVVTNSAVVPFSDEQISWIAQDLHRDEHRCTAMVVHDPAYTSAGRGPSSESAPLWRLAREHGVDVWLSGDAHVYERLGKMDVEGRADRDGIRQFVVGTGGKNITKFGETWPTSEMQARIHGVLFLQLHERGYSWEFVDISGSVRDKGSDTCSR